jgi:hypothetical protein
MVDAKNTKAAKVTKTSLKPTLEGQGAIKIVRASQLAEEGITGVVAAGVLEKTEPNKFNPEKKDYFLRGEDGTLYIINETASLKTQLDQPGILGMNIEINYLGKKESKKKGGKAYHDFDCYSVA